MIFLSGLPGKRRVHNLPMPLASTWKQTAEYEEARLTLSGLSACSLESKTTRQPDLARRGGAGLLDPDAVAAAGTQTLVKV
jgi:hypothetical protein